MNHDQYTLRRTGKPPLQFEGEMLAGADGSRQNGREQNRWHELAAYRTGGGKYVVSVRYRTRWQGESDHDAAQVCDAPGDVGVALETYDPVVYVRGYPAGGDYAEKQARLLMDLRQRYESLVSEILASDPSFAERVG